MPEARLGRRRRSARSWINSSRIYFTALEDGDPVAVADSYHPEGASIGGRGDLVSYSRAELIERYQWLHESPPGELRWIRVHHDVLGVPTRP